MVKNMRSLQEFAQELHVTPKTLNRWLEIAAIRPVEDPHDRRKRLINQDQADSIKELFGMATTPSGGASEAEILELRDQVGTLRVEIAKLTAWISSVAENVTVLTQRSADAEQRDEDQSKRVEALASQMANLSRTPARA